MDNISGTLRKIDDFNLDMYNLDNIDDLFKASADLHRLEEELDTVSHEGSNHPVEMSGAFDKLISCTKTIQDLINSIFAENDTANQNIIRIEQKIHLPEKCVIFFEDMMDEEIEQARSIAEDVYDQFKTNIDIIVQHLKLSYSSLKMQDCVLVLLGDKLYDEGLGTFSDFQKIVDAIHDPKIRNQVIPLLDLVK